MPQKPHPQADGLAGATIEELQTLATTLGLDVDGEVDRRRLASLIRRRRDMIQHLDGGAVQELAVWAGVRLDDQLDAETLVQRIGVYRVRPLDDLSVHALLVLAALRGISVPSGASRQTICERLRRYEGFWGRMRRKRRKIVASLLYRALESTPPDRVTAEADEADEAATTLREHIEDQGVVGGLATKLRGVADDYVARKLDEIEARIDHKLEQIDERMAEWRDREISNRLKILKLTLIFSILVALVSLGYDYLRNHL